MAEMVLIFDERGGGSDDGSVTPKFLKQIFRLKSFIYLTLFIKISLFV